MDLRVIGGHFRGRKLRYHGDPTTRPMKDRVREAIFNLIGPEVKGCHAIDLFAGTGALGLESLSRGAVSATFIEKHIPTARVVEENIQTLEVDDRTELLMTSAFLWGKRDLPNAEFGFPWLVFCSPPYVFYVDRQQEMLELIEAILARMPVGSMMAVEADPRFDFELLPGSVIQKKDRAPKKEREGWDVRTYHPAVVGLRRKGK
ncbi:MAG: 16S rRNA (guanine(966)-N(2))-methyltransferase RsmD [Planctomycetes bacterium]|nr:16S rRNA (guanine(966)-N(2))-methyltransferase RsmD [Planctomycetota bacterium]